MPEEPDLASENPFGVETMRGDTVFRDIRLRTTGKTRASRRSLFERSSRNLAALYSSAGPASIVSRPGRAEGSRPAARDGRRTPPAHGRRAHPGRELHATMSRTRERPHECGSTGSVVVPVRGSYARGEEAAEPSGIDCCMVSNGTHGDPGRSNARVPKSGESHQGERNHPSNESAPRSAGLARQTDAPPPSP